MDRFLQSRVLFDKLFILLGKQIQLELKLIDFMGKFFGLGPFPDELLFLNGHEGCFIL